MILINNKLKKNSYNKLILLSIIIILLHLTITFADEVKDKKSNYQIVKIDERNERLFVITDIETIENIGSVKEIIRQASIFIYKGRKGWSCKWSISFFSNKKFAAYKDDESVLQYVVDGSWSKNYLAEYYNENQILTRFPLQPDKCTETVIKIKK
jgi:hypothetical protein